MVMGKEVRYLVVKKKDSKELIYFEYDKLEGYDVTPKKNKPFQDSIQVNKMILINESLIQKMIQKKLNKRFQKLLCDVNLLFESDDETGTGLREVLNQLERFKMEVKNKYRKYMEKEELLLLGKKLSILQNEAKLRLYYLENEDILEKGGKAR